MVYNESGEVRRPCGLSLGRSPSKVQRVGSVGGHDKESLLTMGEYTPDPTPSGSATEPSVGVALTYQNCLRAIGRLLDRGYYRYTVISQVPEGFVMHGYPQAAENVRSAEAMVFTVSDLVHMVEDCFNSRGVEIDTANAPRILPTGYEDFLRALGFECDEQAMRNVRLVETLEGIVLSYDLEKGKERHERTFDEQQIYELLNLAFSRRRMALKPPRSPGQAAPSVSPLRRIDL